MAVHTILNKDEVSNFLENYNIGYLKDYSGITEGIENTNYLIKTDKQKYILTLYEKRTNKRDIPFYLDLMKFSKNNGLECPLPILSKSQKDILVLKGKNTSLFTFLNGKCLKKWNQNNCFEVGKILAKFHRVNKKFYKKKSNNLGYTGWKKLFKECQKDMDLKISGSRSLLNIEMNFLEKNWPKNLPSGIIHADLFPDNILFSGKKKISGILDFYFSCNDLYIYDLAIAINAWCFENNIFKKHFFNSLIKGYQASRKLTLGERKNLNICLRGAAVRFFFTRMYDLINVNTLNKPIAKDPNDYLKRLKFHLSKNIAEEFSFE